MRISFDFFIFSTYLFTFNYNHIENYNRVNKCNNRFKFAFSLSNVLKLFVWHLNNYKQDAKKLTLNNT